MAPVICLLQSEKAADLAKVKAWSKEQKLPFELYDQSSLLATAEAKSPLAAKIAAEQKVSPTEVSEAQRVPFRPDTELLAYRQCLRARPSRPLWAW